MPRVIITGPTGAIGIALIKECIRNGVEVLALCHKGSQRIMRIPKNPLVDIQEFELDAMDKVAKHVSGDYDIFFHLAWAGTVGDARNDMVLQNSNIGYTLDAVNLAKSLGCSTFVGAGSQAEYGRVEGTISPDTPTNPENGYGMAKLCAGQMTRVMCHKMGMAHVWPRFFSVYGPYDGAHSMVISTINTLLDGKHASFTPCRQEWDYLFSRDAGRALYLAGTKGRDGAIYCVGSGIARPLSEYVEKIGEAVDPAATLGIGELPYSDKQVMYLCADISALQADTGFKPQVTFDDGIKATVDWCRFEQNAEGM